MASVVVRADLRAARVVVTLLVTHRSLEVNRIRAGRPALSRTVPLPPDPPLLRRPGHPGDSAARRAHEYFGVNADARIRLPLGRAICAGRYAGPCEYVRSRAAQADAFPILTRPSLSLSTLGLARRPVGPATPDRGASLDATAMEREDFSIAKS